LQGRNKKPSRHNFYFSGLFLLSQIRIQIVNPDPDPDTPIESGSNPEPDSRALQFKYRKCLFFLSLFQRRRLSRAKTKYRWKQTYLDVGHPDGRLGGQIQESILMQTQFHRGEAGRDGLLHATPLG
jgi:hypothetical protein